MCLSLLEIALKVCTQTYHKRGFVNRFKLGDPFRCFNTAERVFTGNNRYNRWKDFIGGLPN